MLTIIKKIDAILIKAQYAAIIFCVSAMVLLIIWQVIARYVLFLSVPYAEELARLAIVWCIFMGATLGVRFEEHMRVEVLYNIFPKPVQFAVRLTIYVMMVILSLVLVRYGIRYYLVTADDYATTLGFGRNIFYLPTPVCGFLMLCYSLGNGFKHVSDHLKTRSSQDQEKE